MQCLPIMYKVLDLIPTSKTNINDSLTEDFFKMGFVLEKGQIYPVVGRFSLILFTVSGV